MGSSCSSSQSIKDNENVSVKSEEGSTQHPPVINVSGARPVSTSTSDRSYDTESCLSDKGGGLRHATRSPVNRDNDGVSNSGDI
ncbi:hypothetical protein Pmani_007222, partial [Petrolisthes manimaculis]